MKKLFATLISVVLSCLTLFAFVGCSDNGSEGEKREELRACGTFYRLEDAYEDGLISYDDLRSIACYYNGDIKETDFVPGPKEPEKLSDETIQKIKQTYYVETNGAEKGAELDDVGIGGYYGTYKGFAVIEIGASCTSGIGGDPVYYEEYEIGDILFYWYTPLQLWKEIE